MRKFLKYLSDKQLSIQGLLLWLLAMVNIGDSTFWFFAIPAIIILGMQDMLDEIRKISNNDRGSNF